ncbi:MAG TPA: cyclic nucleotide-binding domain-containing protein, partial [Thermoanaerobaculia bacterium]|nr:cyclic nucleotide-binding domain-containing protein [Thermoanaerobaculia bacterium]
MHMHDPGRHEELLGSIPLFESLAADDIASLARRLEEISYEPGDVIFRHGDQGDSLFIIEEGAVEISYGEGKSKVTLVDLFPGQYFGELAVFDGAPRSATATASRKSHLVRLD